jgi:hypothetical protein
MVPVVVGQGARLFPDTGPDIALDLVESRAFPKGTLVEAEGPEMHKWIERAGRVPGWK